MTRIADTIQVLRSRGEGVFVAYITAGDPSQDETPGIIRDVEEAGADIIEVGLPFSDPLADGITIQGSSFRALEHGATVDGVFAAIKKVRAESPVPIVIMTYYNPVYQRGLEQFAKDAKEAGVDGVIVTDLTPEEAGDWIKAARSHHLDTIFLLAPTSTDDRIKLACDLSTGFIYCVSRTGVTGARETLPPELHSLLTRVKSYTDKPVVVGFGVSTPEHVRQICEWCDGVVVGSAIVKIIDEYDDPVKRGARLRSYISELKAATIPSTSLSKSGKV